jgi:hypothetical protein
MMLKEQFWTIGVCLVVPRRHWSDGLPLPSAYAVSVLQGTGRAPAR